MKLDDFDGKQVRHVKRVATFFLIVMAGVFFTHSFLLGSSSSQESVVVTETILEIGLPDQMEAQLETWARDQPVGASLDFGECSRAEKVEDRKWVLEIC